MNSMASDSKRKGLIASQQAHNENIFKNSEVIGSLNTLTVVVHSLTFEESRRYTASINVSTSAGRWTTHRNSAEFATLDQNLKAAFKRQAILPKLPRVRMLSHLWGKLRPDAYKKGLVRKLDGYLNALVGLPDFVARSRLVAEFLASNDIIMGASPAVSNEPGAGVHEDRNPGPPRTIKVKYQSGIYEINYDEGTTGAIMVDSIQNVFGQMFKPGEWYYEDPQGERITIACKEDVKTAVESFNDIYICI